MGRWKIRSIRHRKAATISSNETVAAIIWSKANPRASHPRNHALFVRNKRSDHWAPIYAREANVFIVKAFPRTLKSVPRSRRNAFPAILRIPLQEVHVEASWKLMTIIIITILRVV